MFLNPMKNVFLILASLFLLASCSTYQKALKSEDMGLKYSVADSLYKAGKYKKSIKLWEQLVPSYRGKPQAERVQYLYADSYYNAGGVYRPLAAYQFDRFVASFPQSEKAEEAEFKGAESYYAQSPAFNLDQTDTEKALDKLQVFIGKYPESKYTDKANELITDLTTKLEKKAFEIAKQYNTIMKYPVALDALDDFLIDYPGSVYREDALFYKLDSQYKYAINSFNVLVEDRLKEAIEMYNTLISYFPEGSYREQADEIKAEIDKRLQNFT